MEWEHHTEEMKHSPNEMEVDRLWDAMNDIEDALPAEVRRYLHETQGPIPESLLDRLFAESRGGA